MKRGGGMEEWRWERISYGDGVRDRGRFLPQGKDQEQGTVQSVRVHVPVCLPGSGGGVEQGAKDDTHLQLCWAAVLGEVDLCLYVVERALQGRDERAGWDFGTSYRRLHDAAFLSKSERAMLEACRIGLGTRVVKERTASQKHSAQLKDE